MLQKFLTCTIALAVNYFAVAQTNKLEELTVDSASTLSTAAAEETKPKPVISGSADVYYRYNFQNPKSSLNNFTSFTNSHNSFELGMASVKVEHSIGKVGMVADIGFGRRADEFSYNDGGSTRLAIKQLYVSYSPSSKVKLTMGSWATHVGYELVDAYLNRNYSMSYMFSYGPFFHTGVKGEFTLGGKTVLMLGVSNPSDLKTATGLPKMGIGQLATASGDDKLKAYINYQGGKYNDSSRLYQGDVVLTYAIADKFSIGYNGTYQSRQGKVANKWSSAAAWWGSALYLNLDPAPAFGLTLRGEYFSDKKNVLGFDGSVFETTLSANFKIDNLTIIPELRLDNASNAPGIFEKSSGAATKSTQSFILAAVYHF